ncbi:MAG: CPBP family intramembrane metalloprotease [candidate division KSB1 bacterium]|nr:CPBP family intramembrane metalloprotease [candidate division KSB1 bacterium]
MKHHYPTIRQTWGITALLILIALLFAGLFILLASLRLFSFLLQNAWTMPILYSLQFSLILFITLRWKKRREPNFTFSWRGISSKEAVLIAAATAGLYFLVDPLTEIIPMPELFKRILIELLGRRDAATFFMLAIAAPFFEELLFRGIILDGFMKNYSTARAVFWSAFFFGFGHLNPWQFIGAALLGAFMGWIYANTRSLPATMFIHALTNGGSFFLSILFIPNPHQLVSTRELFGSLRSYIAFLMLCFAVTVVSIYLLHTFWSHRGNSTASTELHC